jgi:GNAT superfamily N-acetyltransferase
MANFEIRHMQRDDRGEIARLIHHSTNRYYASIGRPPIFPGEPDSPAVMFDVYERLDPGEGLVAVHRETGRIVGSCFVHPRETHVSLGIMNASPDHFGQGIARAILQRIVNDAGVSGKPVRLVSSCFNLDSFSLYTRAGFVPFCTYQDLFLAVPEQGLPHRPPAGVTVREATLEDVDSMERLEREVSGISRPKDFRYCIENSDGLWHVSVAHRGRQIEGFLISCSATALNMLGPGVARTQQQAAALIHAELDRHRGRSPLFLVPVACKELVQQLYSWGARNCEIHVAQVHGVAQAPAGVTMPTFLPESG